LANAHAPTLENSEFRGWNAIVLSNGLVRAVAVPDIGGRVMAYDLGEYPYLFVDPLLAGRLFTCEENQGDGSLAAWKNYGGDKTWPSPQGWDTEQQWHGPPDPVLDSGRYRVSGQGVTDGAAYVEMVSPPDLRTGVQITRKLSLYIGTTRATLDLSFRNIGDKPIRWSIWDVLQLNSGRQLANGSLSYEPGCTVTASLNPKSKFAQGFYVMFGEPSNPQWRVDREQELVVADYAWEIGKIGADACTPDGENGWIAFCNTARGYAFAERFRVFPGEEYPDGGSTVECWTVGKGKVANLDYEHSGIYLMETEVLSPFYTFQPGESRSFQIEWGACRAEGRIVDVQAGGCASDKLSAQLTAGKARLTGSFGVFDVGRLCLTWLDAAGAERGSIVLGEANPHQPVALRLELTPPGGVKAAVLSVLAEADGAPRSLGRCELTG
jgi:hypothetical protein